jgi:Dolichyl-phosphate-mannose-protein mannosyltransferase
VQSAKSPISSTASGAPAKFARKIVATNPEPTTTPAGGRRELRVLLGVWLAVAVAWLWLGGATATKLGFNYDEAIFAGLAKDFTTGEVHGRHMPGSGTVMLWNRPFPIWNQPYLGSVKSWQLIPWFTFFEPNAFIARMSNLAWALAGLLFFMLWVRKLFGLAEAVAGALLIATDPAFFYTSLLDWGAFVPSFVCRCAGFFFALLAWREQKARWFFLAGAALGFGFFNKVDFAVVLAAATVAAVVAYTKPTVNFLGAQRKNILLAALGFVVGAGPMMAMSLRMFFFAAANNAPVNPGEFSEKLHTLAAMYDGSYFYRMLAAGGLFDKMQTLAPPVWTPLGILIIAAFAVLAWQTLGLPAGSDARRARIFLLAALVLATLGVFLLPRAVRIYHAILAAPFAQLIIAVAVVGLWRKFSESGKKSAGALVVLIFAGLLAAQILAVAKTEKLIFATHGRGWWSDAQEQFAAMVKDRADLTLVSLDWGFHESLLFLTDKPTLVEPFWKLAGTDPAKLPQDTNLVYLAHPPEYSLSPFGAAFLEFSRKNPRAKIADWRDREGKIVFYTVQFAAP